MKDISKVVLVVVSCGFFASCGKKKSAKVVTVEEAAEEYSPSLGKLPGLAATSQKCKGCHEEIYAKWEKSQHGLANRLAGLPLDAEKFVGQALKTTVEDWKFQQKNGELQVEAKGQSYHAEMAIGESPLVQYLVKGGGGRWQTTSAAWDTEKKEWFDTLNGDARTGEDWGHWTGRGMTWNVQCAYCHMTGFEKNYDLQTDTYHSSWDEMGVGCIQCHGGLAENPAAGTGCLIDTKGHAAFSLDQVMDGCATCHSRRGELDEKFSLGDHFEDHYQLSLPTVPGLYYADGQIQDEDYVYGSLLMSKMGHAGVSCMECHDPHQAEVKMPFENNMLCMQCHASGTNGRISGATVIVPEEHSHHGGGSTGNRCVECHMTQTVYMGNDPRRDHGFHIPDPLMTKEAGIPNACNKCHTEESTDWAIGWVDQWYGEKMDRPERARTRAVQAVYDQDANAISPLLEVYGREVNATWRASLLQMMQPWAIDARVQEAAVAATVDEEPRVRAVAASLIEFGPANGPRLEALLRDPIKEVRLAAAWSMRRTLSRSSEVGKEVEATLNHGVDQPVGVHRRAQLAIDQGRLEEAEQWLQRAVALDKTSAGGWEAYAILLGQMGRHGEALAKLRKAAALAPDSGRYPYLMALVQAEAGDQKMTEELFRKAVEIDPEYDRAWYNLGLLLAGQERLKEALEAIRQAEAVNQQTPEYPFALATIYLRLGDKEAAREVAIKAVKINPRYQPAVQFLLELEKNP